MKFVQASLFVSVLTLGLCPVAQAQQSPQKKPEQVGTSNKYRNSHRRVRTRSVALTSQRFVGKAVKRTFHVERIEDGAVLVRYRNLRAASGKTVGRVRKTSTLHLGPGLSERRLKWLVGKDVTFELQSDRRGKLFIQKFSLAR